MPIRNATRTVQNLTSLSFLKIIRLGGKMSTYVKYPRTPHVPWSLGATDDDKRLPNMHDFLGKVVVITEKMDGENTTLYPDGHMHARSIDSAFHESRSWTKNFWSGIAHELPHNYRVCGENLYARHSIGYDDLESYFYGFSMWEEGCCLSWGETVLWFRVLGIVPVPVLYHGIYDRAIIREIEEQFDTTASEGYVIRVADSFDLTDFTNNVAKWVREDHVQTDEHWSKRTVIPNKLKG